MFTTCTGTYMNLLTSIGWMERSERVSSDGNLGCTPGSESLFSLVCGSFSASSEALIHLSTHLLGVHTDPMVMGIEHTNYYGVPTTHLYTVRS